MLDFIGGIVYINLDHRTDRNKHIKSQLAAITVLDTTKVKVHRLSAIKQHLVGCLKSHLLAIKYARAQGWKSVLIFEDDFEWAIDANEAIKLLGKFWDQYQNSFGFVQLCSSNVTFATNNDLSLENCVLPQGYTPTVRQVTKASNAAAYLVHQRCYDALIDVFEKAVNPLALTGAHWLYLNDVVWNHVRPLFPTYAFTPTLGHQIEGYSDLSRAVKAKDST